MQVQQEVNNNRFFSRKVPFQINKMFALIEEAVKPFPKAMLFEIYDRGYQDPFQILVACMISIQTLDEVSLVVSLRLFSKAKTPKEIAKLTLEELDEILDPANYHLQKAERILVIAQRIIDDFGGKLPCDEKVLLSFSGVGPKTAHLVLGVASGKPYIGVDTHVHRITNRWGYVRSKTPQKTEAQLAGKLPKKHWVHINELLVPFGKHICTWDRPKCSTCPVLKYCRQVGVFEHR